MSQLDRVWRQSRLSNTTKLRIYNSCVLSSLLYASETWTLLKADRAILEAFHMTNQRRILGILWYEFVTNVEVANLSQLPYINNAINRKRHSFSLATSGVWIRLLLLTKPYISQSRHDRAQDSLAPGGDNQVVRENAGWSKSPRAQGSFVLMLGVLRQIGQHGGRYDPSTVKHRERGGAPWRDGDRADNYACQCDTFALRLFW